MKPLPYHESIFNTKDYFDSYAKSYQTCKKAFESFLEHELTRKLDVGQMNAFSSTPGLFETLEVTPVSRVKAKGFDFELPQELITADTEVLCKTLEFIMESLPENERKILLSMLPGKNEAGQKETFKKLVSNEKMGFMTPADTFHTLLQQGHFTDLYEKERQLESKINKHYYKKAIISNLETGRSGTNRGGRLEGGGYGQAGLINQMYLDKLDDDCFSVKTLECSADEFPVEEDDRQSMAERSIANPESPALGKRDLLTLMETRSNNSRTNDPRSFNSKAAKNNIVTISASTPEWIANFRIQEHERYRNPTQPWMYKMENGSGAVVAPVCKKSNLTTKAREHYLLKTERPSYVTILCLVRDAAAKLPNGVGTRADICELLKESQYINENIPDKKINEIVSGALDRLHYETDPCVRYDSDKKLWIYLHRDRQLDSRLWEDGPEIIGKL